MPADLIHIKVYLFFTFPPKRPWLFLFFFVLFILFVFPSSPHAPKILQKRYKILTRYKFHSGEEGGGRVWIVFFFLQTKTQKGAKTD